MLLQRHYILYSKQDDLNEGQFNFVEERTLWPGSNICAPANGEEMRVIHNPEDAWPLFHASVFLIPALGLSHCRYPLTGESPGGLNKGDIFLFISLFLSFHSVCGR